MASTTFTSGTVVASDWLNDVNDATYNGTGVFTPAGTGAVARTMQDKGREFISVKDFGAVGDGITDDSAAFVLALAVSAAVYLPPGIYLVNSGVALSTGSKKLFGAGRKASIIKTTGNIACITITSNYNEIHDLGFLGTGKGATYDASGNASQRGIYLNGGGTVGLLNLISGCHFTGFGRAGVTVEQTNASAHQPNQLNGCLFDNNNIGLERAVQGEYVSAVGCDFWQNHYGEYIRGGNAVTVGGSSVDNLTGVFLASGSNDSHGVHTGMLINHNIDYNVRAQAITNGYVFEACAMYEGDILLTGSAGVVIRNGLLDAIAYYFDGSFGTLIEGNRMPGAYSNTINNDYNANPSHTQWRNNRPLSGIQSGGEFEGGAVYATPGNDTWTPAQLAAVQTVTWAGANESMYLHTGYTKHDLFNANQFICRGLSGKPVKLRAVIRVQINAADDWLALFIYVRRNGSIRQYMNRTKLSATVVQFESTTDVPLAAGDLLDFQIGATGYANNVTVLNTTPAFVEVEGL